MRLSLSSHHLLPLLFIFTTWLIFFSPLIFGGKVYYFGDIQDIYYPLEYEYAAAQGEGRLPEWSQYFGFGQPLLSWGQLGFFTPVHVLLRLFGLHPLLILQLSLMTYSAAGAVGMYYFLYRNRLRPPAATLGSLLYVFSGFHIGHIGHVNFYTATMLLPWLLVTIDFFLAQPTLRRTVFIAAVGAAIALSGQPQVVLYTYAAAALFALGSLFLQFWHLHRSELTKIVSFALLAVLLALLLSSFAILPPLEFLPLTERDAALAEEQLFDFSYPPAHAITLILPYFFGDYNSYWGAKGFQELAAFVGIVPLALAGIGLFAPSAHRNLRLWGSICLLSGIAFSLGKYSPLYTYLVTHKYLTTLAVPGRFVMYFIIGICILASLGLNELIQRDATRTVRHRLSAVLLPLLLCIPFFIQVGRDTLVRTQLLELITSLSPSLMVVALGVIGVGAFVIRNQQFSRSLVFQYGIVAIAGITLLIYAWNYNPRSDRRSALAVSPLTGYLERYAATHTVPARLYSRDSIAGRLTAAQSARLEGVDIDQPALSRHLQVTAHASSARWIGALSIRPYREFIERFFANDGEPIDGDNRDVTLREKQLFDMAGVSTLVSATVPDAPEVVSKGGYILRETFSLPPLELRVYNNPTVFPKAFLVFDAEFLDAADEIRAKFVLREVDPAQTAVLSGPTPPLALPHLKDVPMQPATITRYASTEVEILTETDRPAVLVLSDTTTPQWHTYIDGQLAPYYVANSMFRSALVPSGKHTVVFRYNSPAITTATWASLVGLILSALFLFFSPLAYLQRYRKSFTSHSVAS